jgi:hypothetical protein
MDTEQMLREILEVAQENLDYALLNLEDACMYPELEPQEKNTLEAYGFMAGELSNKLEEVLINHKDRVG